MDRKTPGAVRHQNPRKGPVLGTLAEKVAERIPYENKLSFMSRNWQQRVLRRNLGYFRTATSESLCPRREYQFHVAT